MKPIAESNSFSVASVHQFDGLYSAVIPIPALQRGWLHSRKLALTWHTERILAKFGDQCWFSRYHRENRDPDPESIKFRPFAIAGFWPTGGFVELELGRANPLEDPPTGWLEVHAESPAGAEALMNELVKGYRHEPSSSDVEPQIGILNVSFKELTVERVSLSAQQIVPRTQLDLFYGKGTALWVTEWIRVLTSRRYGLSLLTGSPGTGKTTLVRSLAHWLGASHLFYFMPATRFVTIESGAIFEFLTAQNRYSRLRKILILEDAESILQRRGDDNRDKVATLLNLTDGMLGDALGLHVICTLNSDLTEIDPALLRPGRLLAHRDFHLLSGEDAARLASVLGVPAPNETQVSLAEFFNPSSDEALSSRAPRREIGFHIKLPDKESPASLTLTLSH